VKPNLPRPPRSRKSAETERRQLSQQQAAFSRQQEQQAAVEAGLRAAQQRLQEEVARLQQAEKNYIRRESDISLEGRRQHLEAANLRRLVTELQSSLSWKITAPLRFLTKPLFQLLGRRRSPANYSAGAHPAIASVSKQEGTVDIISAESARLPVPSTPSCRNCAAPSRLP